MCSGHHERWSDAGRPDPGVFAVSPEAAAPWRAHVPLTGCKVPGCGFGSAGRRLCYRHLGAWRRAGAPGDDAGWLAGLPAVVPAAGQRSCRISCCRLWAHPAAALCFAHQRRWKGLGRPALEEFIAGYDAGAASDRERADLSVLPGRLRLEIQYALQCRRDDNMVRTGPVIVRSMIRWAAGTGAVSLLDHTEREWRAGRVPGGPPGEHVVPLVVYAHRKVTDLAEGEGWDNEYPRDTWQLRRLGIRNSRCATLQFAGITQPRLQELVKRWTRWRLGTGLAAISCYRGVHVLTGLSRFLAVAGVTDLSGISREVLERYLADLPLMSGRKEHGYHVGQIATFLRDVRRHRWDASLPASAQIFPEDYPRPGERLPRALAGHVMTQVEDPANLAREDNPAYRLITLLLIRCGLRISDACKLTGNCVVTDADGAPYLRYYNHKMKREALVPIDEELQALIGRQRERNRQRRNGSTPVLFPRPHANIDGTRPLSSGTYREALDRWLEQCEVRDEYGQPVHLSPHQWRHTLGTVLINRDVPQHVVQKILDQDSPRMTAHYARLSDKTVREHWEKARKVNAEGQPVQVRPDGPLGDAAWAKQRLSRATQALPNGYCQLPLIRTCPHANSCLTCPMFLTTAEFLPQHHAQRQQTLQIITAAEAAGHTRVAEMNRQVAGNLDKIITSLEDGHEEEGKAAGDAC